MGGKERMFDLGQRSLYAKIHSDENLTEAWHHVRQGSDAAGVDGVSVVQFQRRLFSHLKEIQSQLQQSCYEPDLVKRFTLPKPNGKRRQLGLLTVRDRVAQAAVLRVIEPLFEARFEPFSYAYRPSRNPQMAIDHVRRLASSGRPWIVDVDVESCFDRIPLDCLFKVLCRRIKNRKLRRLLHRWLELQALNSKPSEHFRKPRHLGLLQGGLLSPLLSNIYLDQFDKAATQRGLKVVRYADDIVVLCVNRRYAKSALKTAQKLLEQLGLPLNPQKTQIRQIDHAFSYLGEPLGSIRAAPMKTAHSVSTNGKRQPVPPGVHAPLKKGRSR